MKYTLIVGNILQYHYRVWQWMQVGTLLSFLLRQKGKSANSPISNARWALLLSQKSRSSCPRITTEEVDPQIQPVNPSPTTSEENAGPSLEVDQCESEIATSETPLTIGSNEKLATRQRSCSK